MKPFGFRSRRGSALAARDRLKILLAQDRALFGRRDLITLLREEVILAIAKHVAIDVDKVRVNLDRRGGIATLGIDIDLPAHKGASLAGA
ncbi:cell division topological specificity factor MinE [Methylobacterium sp. 4-46]|uniref:cell division topological specificity factor MinE n=1 Tax=unclassified Methylobacterium TaxID=2615210 RepID=UPI000152E9A8|nr:MULTISPECIES: cell division topological specificity factor MinE [Methylobacterium]ACA14858.1 cell division topological specificity factor MinE [Methylobacterium sp. 4-46]WFT80600.1 cell division topological specificity factor MinE [Methylobacterium nodulans]